jgi:hypothetical protein
MRRSEIFGHAEARRGRRRRGKRRRGAGDGRWGSEGGDGGVWRELCGAFLAVLGLSRPFGAGG